MADLTITAQRLRSRASDQYHRPAVRQLAISLCGGVVEKLDDFDPVPDASLSVVAAVSAFLLSAAIDQYREVHPDISSDDVRAAFLDLLDVAAPKLGNAISDGLGR
jgi:hypothetical protein